MKKANNNKVPSEKLFTHVTYFDSRLYIAYYDVMNLIFGHSYDLTSSFPCTV